MTLDPTELQQQLDVLESIEKASLRLVVQAVFDFRQSAEEIFREEQDLVADIGEDITREALDRLGMSTIPVRLFGKIDYKRAKYLFLPEYSVRQALFVDSKAEKIAGARTATIQTAQTSMTVRQRRRGKIVSHAGSLPTLLDRHGTKFLTTSIFVKYNYREAASHGNELASISVISLPNGILQDRYNPDADHGFWLAGRNAPSRGEAFRVRIGIGALKEMANWRVQSIQVAPEPLYTWDD